MMEHLKRSGQKPEWLAFIQDPEALEVFTSCADHQHKDYLCMQPSDLPSFSDWSHLGIAPSLIFIETSSMEPPFTELNTFLDGIPSNIGIIVLGAENDIGRYRQLQQMGISEYLFLPITEDLLMRACFTPGMKKIEPLEQNKILIPVIGVRGGVGATSVAINAAYHWSLLPRQRVCLVDLDIQAGDVGLNLDISEHEGLHEALTESERIDSIFLANILVEKKENLFVITNDWSVMHPYVGAQITDAALQHFLMLLYDRADTLFFDLSFPLNKDICRMILLQASICILVTDLSLSAIRDTVQLVQWLKMHFPGLKVKIIANTSRPLLNSELMQSNLEQAIGRSLDLVLPYCKEQMQQTALNGDIFADQFKKSPFARKLYSFIQNTAQEQRVAFPDTRSFWQRLRDRL